MGAWALHQTEWCIGASSMISTPCTQMQGAGFVHAYVLLGRLSCTGSFYRPLLSHQQHVTFDGCAVCARLDT